MPSPTRYFVALDAWDQGRRDDVPPGWRVVFERIATRRTSPLEDLVVGVYAHIVHDLPFVLAELAEDGGDRPIGAYHRVNDVIAGAMDEIVEDVGRRYSPWIRWLDRLGGDVDEMLSDYGIRVGPRDGLVQRPAPPRPRDPRARPGARWTAAPSCSWSGCWSRPCGPPAGWRFAGFAG